MENTLYTIQNETTRAVIARYGAELYSLTDLRSGREQIWQRDPAVWTGCAPWLFPFIGKLREGRYLHDGTAYTPAMHGFAKRSYFDAVEQTSDTLHLCLTESAETLAVWPWHFALHITYRLEDARLLIDVRLENTDTRTMFFSFGAHPGFVCADGDRLVFETPERMTVHRLTADTHLLQPAQPDETDTAGLVLEPALFENDAMILEAPASRSVTLVRADGSGVVYSFPQVPWLGIWSRYGERLHYVCVEPWFGVDDPVDADGLIEHKTGIQILPAGEEFRAEYSIGII